MLQTVSRLLPELPLILMTAVATHLVMSFAQTLMHYKLGHHPIGGKFFRNHINFHHAHYCKDHLVSRTYLGDEGNNTPFFFIPVFLVGACTYLVCRLLLEKKTERGTSGTGRRARRPRSRAIVSPGCPGAASIAMRPAKQASRARPWNSTLAPSRRMR